MDTIIINVKQINKMNMSLGLYLSLYYLYCLKENPKIHAEFIKAHGPVDFPTAKSLEDLKYIKITDGSKGEFEIREPARLLFEGEKDLFYTWILTFPIKTPSGRYLSPKGHNTVAGKKLRKKWKRLFGNDTMTQQRVINILQAEVDWRKTHGKQEFMHNAETWLNQGDWEKYEDLLKENQQTNLKRNEDFI